MEILDTTWFEGCWYRYSVIPLSWVVGRCLSGLGDVYLGLVSPLLQHCLFLTNNLNHSYWLLLPLSINIAIFQSTKNAKLMLHQTFCLMVATNCNILRNESINVHSLLSCFGVGPPRPGKLGPQTQNWHSGFIDELLWLGMFECERNMLCVCAICMVYGIWYIYGYVMIQTNSVKKWKRMQKAAKGILDVCNASDFGQSKM